MVRGDWGWGGGGVEEEGRESGVGGGGVERVVVERRRGGGGGEGWGGEIGRGTGEMGTKTQRGTIKNRTLAKPKKYAA